MKLPAILSGAKNPLFILCPFAAAIAVSPAAAQYQQQQQQRQNPAQRNALQRQAQARQNYFLDLKTIVDKLAAKNDTKIVLDPAIIVMAKPSAPADDASLNAALDALSTQLRKTAWRRVYLKKGVTIGPSDTVKIAEAVRAMEQIEHAGLVLENPASRQATLYVKSYPVSGTFKQDLEDQAYNTTPVYVLFSTVARPGSAKSLAERMADLQQEQMDLMMQMDPDQMASAVGNGLQMWMNMDPAIRGQMMGTMMRAGMQMFQQMPPEQRQQMIQDMLGNMQGLFPGGAPPPPPPH